MSDAPTRSLSDLAWRPVTRGKGARRGDLVAVAPAGELDSLVIATAAKDRVRQYSRYHDRGATSKWAVNYQLHCPKCTKPALTTATQRRAPGLDDGDERIPVGGALGGTRCPFFFTVRRGVDSQTVEFVRSPGASAHNAACEAKREQYGELRRSPAALERLRHLTHLMSGVRNTLIVKAYQTPYIEQEMADRPELTSPLKVRAPPT